MSEIKMKRRSVDDEAHGGEKILMKKEMESKDDGTMTEPNVIN